MSATSECLFEIHVPCADANIADFEILYVSKQMHFQFNGDRTSLCLEIGSQCLVM